MYAPCSSTVLDCYLAVFFIPILSSSGYAVVMVYIILCALSYVHVFYTFFFIVLFCPSIGADLLCFLFFFMFFGTFCWNINSQE